MPFTWTLEHDSRLHVVQVWGTVDAAAFAHFQRNIALRWRHLGYGALLLVDAGDLFGDGQILPQLRVLARDSARTDTDCPLTPLAIVPRTPLSELLAGLFVFYRRRAGGTRPVEIFRTPQAARAWLATHPALPLAHPPQSHNSHSKQT